MGATRVARSSATDTGVPFTDTAGRCRVLSSRERSAFDTSSIIVS
jgi:hypothetical protein